MPAQKLSTKREQFLTRAQNGQEQARIEHAKILNGCPFLSPRARLISVTFTGAATYVLKHGLGVPAQCFRCSLEYEKATFFDVRVSGDQTALDPNQQLRIISNGSGTCDLWVYPKASATIPTGATQSA